MWTFYVENVLFSLSYWASSHLVVKTLLLVERLASLDTLLNLNLNLGNISVKVMYYY